MATGTPTPPAPDQARPAASEEPAIAWPTGRLLGAVVAVAAAAAAGWALAGWLGPWGAGVAAAGTAGSGLVAALTAASIAALQPWKVRRISTWMHWWMGGTVARLVAVPAATYLLYSATHLSAGALILGVGLTYVLTLLAEAAVLAQHARRAA